MLLDFSLFNDSNHVIQLDEKRIVEAIKSIAVDHDVSLHWVNAVFLDNDPHTELNASYLNHNYDTDVLTFDLSDEQSAGGEVYINADVAVSNAQSFKQPAEMEFYRLILHGVLHLCGQNDKTETEQQEMRAKEDRYLKSFM